MPVQLSLNSDQMAVLNTAVKGKDITLTTSGRSVVITGENVTPIREAVAALHHKKANVKTKKVDHLEICYHAEEIMRRLDRIANEFSPANDTEIGIVGTANDDGSINVQMNDGSVEAKGLGVVFEADEGAPEIDPDVLSGAYEALSGESSEDDTTDETGEEK